MLSEEIGKLEDKVECANNALQADWDRWKESMRLDVKMAFSDVAENNIRYYEQAIICLQNHGLVINREKSFLIPEQVEVHLGVYRDTLQGKVFLSQEWQLRMQDMFQESYRKHQEKDMIPWARFHTRPL
ncbi:UNVERIFIED_CONTAM: hypothetical protein K2H54_041177 [Gekko kuhli]